MGGESGIKGVSVRNGNIRIIVNHDKKRYAKTLKIKPTPANLRYAARQREAWLHELSTGSTPDIFVDTVTSQVKQLLADWLDRKEKQIKASTFNDYKKSVDVLISEFGHHDISELNLGHIRDYCDRSSATAKRINNVLSPLRQSIQLAVDYQIIPSNILSGWSYKKITTKTDDEVDPFSSDEQLAILNQITGQARNLIQFAFWTGLRTSEYIALKWSDIDFTNNTIKISRAKTQTANKAEAPKTISGNRTIKILSGALDALLNQKQYTYLAGDEVFHNPRTDEPWAGDQPIRRTLWMPALKKAGVRYRRPYQTRHTYASMMLSAGEHPMWVAKQMGHSDWSMIARTYGKWMPDAMPDAGQKAEAIFGIIFGSDRRGNRGN